MNGLDPELVPWSERAEQSVLSALLQDNFAWDRVGDILSTESFFAYAHQVIFEAISVLLIACKGADVITVYERLKAMDKLEEAGGLGYLNAIAAAVPSAAHVRRYAEIVADKALRRALLRTADEAKAAALADGDAAEILNDCAGMFTKLQQDGARTESQHIGQAVLARIDHYNDLAAGNIKPGVSTGFEELDAALTGGMREGKVIVIAARPSVGKTALALSIVLNAAKNGHPGNFLSQEMDNGSLVDRAIANAGRISYANLLTGKMTDQEWSRLAQATDFIGNLPVHLDDQAALTLAAIRSKAIRAKRDGLRVLAIDYLQLCQASRASSRENRDNQIGEISRGIKQLARDLKITVLLLSQLNRAVEKRAGVGGAAAKPTLADLRESGAIEQDADVVLMLWPIRMDAGNRIVGAYVPKNREGKPEMEWTWKFQGYWQRFVKDEADTAHRGGSYEPGSGGFDN